MHEPKYIKYIFHVLRLVNGGVNGITNFKQGTYWETNVHSRGQKITCICNSLSLGHTLILCPVVRIWRKYTNRNKVFHSFKQFNNIGYFQEIISRDY